MRKLSSIGIAIGLLAAALGIAACGGDGSGGGSGDTSTAASSSQLPQGSEPVNLDPADFTTDITNQYWPMSPGSRWVYRETDGKGGVQRVVVTVTDQTKVIDGVTARAVHDVVSEDGQPVEVTDDYYAQDSSGTLWYLGENTAEYENGKVSSREGSFEAGVDGAQAGVILPGDPQVGQSYRQEYKAGEAEDQGKILTLDGTVTVPFGHFTGALGTEDSNPLDGSVEHKFYAKGVGPVQTLDVGTKGQEVLLSYVEG